VELSVVIPVRNEERYLREQLDALVTQEWHGTWEIVVVDNGSTDATAAIVHSYSSQHDRVRYVRADAVADQSFAANAGVAVSNADAVAFCDGDDVVAAGWVAAMAEGLARHAVVTGAEELDHLNPEWLAATRGRSLEGPIGSFAGIFPLVRGNNYGVRREVWDEVGPLRASFFPVADMEFSLRCWLHDIEIVGLPSAVVHYRYRASARDLWRQGWAYGSHRPLIARLLRDAHRPAPPRFGGWKSWVALAAGLPGVVTRRGRARWLWLAGNRFGQVAGSIRHRTMMV
jgi:glycosyltransferase involved in cell wall biosynthesis